MKIKIIMQIKSNSMIKTCRKTLNILTVVHIIVHWSVERAVLVSLSLLSEEMHDELINYIIGLNESVPRVSALCSVDLHPRSMDSGI